MSEKLAADEVATGELDELVAAESCVTRADNADHDNAAQESDDCSTFLRHAYVYLRGKSVPVLRQMAGRWNVLQSGANKEIFVARIFVFIHSEVTAGNQTVHQLLETDRSWGFQKFLSSWSPAHENKRVPDISLIKETATKKSKPPAHISGKIKRSRSTSERPSGRSKKSKSSQEEASADGGSLKQKPFTLNEFARLLVVLRDQEDVKEVYAQSGQVLTKDQLDRGEKSSNIWSRVVSPAFNDPLFRPMVNFADVVENIDCSSPPPTKRDGSVLQRQIKSFEKEWNIWDRRYKASGQNDPDFAAYLERSGLDPTSPNGKRLLIASVIWNSGTANEEVCFRLVSRVIGFSNDELGDEGGMCHPDDEEKKNNGTQPQSSRVGRVSCRRSRDRTSLENVVKTDEAMREAAVAFRDRCRQVSKTDSETEKSERDGYKWKEKESMLLSLRRIASEMKTMPVNGVENDDEELEQDVRRRFKSFADELREKLDKSSPRK